MAGVSQQCGYVGLPLKARYEFSLIFDALWTYWLYPDSWVHSYSHPLPWSHTATGWSQDGSIHSDSSRKHPNTCGGHSPLPTLDSIQPSFLHAQLLITISPLQVQIPQPASHTLAPPPSPPSIWYLNYPFLLQISTTSPSPPPTTLTRFFACP